MPPTTVGITGSGGGKFDLPHGIALDDRGRVYVADRGNARVEIFESDVEGAFGRPFDIAFRADGVAFIADGGDTPSQPPDRSRVIAVARDGHVIGQFGKFGVYDGQFDRAHDLAVSNDGSVYVGDANGRVQKFASARATR